MILLKYKRNNNFFFERFGCNILTIFWIFLLTFQHTNLPGVLNPPPPQPRDDPPLGPPSSSGPRGQELIVL